MNLFATTVLAVLTVADTPLPDIVFPKKPFRPSDLVEMRIVETQVRIRHLEFDREALTRKGTAAELKECEGNIAAARKLIADLRVEMKLLAEKEEAKRAKKKKRAEAADKFDLVLKRLESLEKRLGELEKRGAKAEKP